PPPPAPPAAVPAVPSEPAAPEPAPPAAPPVPAAPALPAPPAVPAAPPAPPPPAPACPWPPAPPCVPAGPGVPAVPALPPLPVVRPAPHVVTGAPASTTSLSALQKPSFTAVPASLPWHSLQQQFVSQLLLIVIAEPEAKHLLFRPSKKASRSSKNSPAASIS